MAGRIAASQPLYTCMIITIIIVIVSDKSKIVPGCLICRRAFLRDSGISRKRQTHQSSPAVQIFSGPSFNSHANETNRTFLSTRIASQNISHRDLLLMRLCLPGYMGIGMSFLAYAWSLILHQATPRRRNFTQAPPPNSIRPDLRR